MKPVSNKQEIKRLDEKLEKQYKYYTDTRKPNQIQLTNQLARKLSDLSFLSIPSKPIVNSNKKSIRKEDILYVCLKGVPPYDEEFKFLQLPGECLQFELTFYEKGKTEEQLKSIPAQLQEQAKILDKRINQKSKQKPIVFVYHSFGTFIFAAYCNYFSTERIIGLIDVGGAPIRFYPIIKWHVRNQEQISLEVLEDNLDFLYQTHIQANKRQKIQHFKNKYEMLGFIKCVKNGFGFKDTFQILRKLPKVLKCFIYGRKDVIFEQNLINQKVVYYSYQSNFQEKYEQQLKKAYLRRFKIKPQSVQSRFIFSVEEGHHSMHMQKKFKDTVANIVKHYLQYLQEVYAEQQPKL